MKHRTQEKLEQRIKEILATFIHRDLSDPRLGFVTVHSVALSPELDQATVYMSVLGEAGERSRSLHALRSAAGFLRRELGSVLHLRKTPALRFELDDQLDVALRVEDAIRRARSEDEARHPDAPDPDAPDPDAPDPDATDPEDAADPGDPEDPGSV